MSVYPPWYEDPKTGEKKQQDVLRYKFRLAGREIRQSVKTARRQRWRPFLNSFKQATLCERGCGAFAKEFHNWTTPKRSTGLNARPAMPETDPAFSAGRR